MVYVMDKKVNKSFRIESNVVKALEELSKKSGYSQTDLLEFAVCNLYSMYFDTCGKVLNCEDKDFLTRLEVLRIQFKNSI